MEILDLTRAEDLQRMRRLASIRRWELVASGHWDEGPAHSGRIELSLGRRKRDRTWVLAQRDLEVRSPRQPVVAIIDPAPELDEHAIVRLLLELARDRAQVEIHEVQRGGRFDLDPG